MICSDHWFAINKKDMLYRKTLTYVGLLLVSLLGVYACTKNGGKKDNTDQLDRKPMLTHYADEYVLPGYDALLQDLNTLKSKTDAFTGLPTTISLNELKVAWKEAYLSWQTVDMLEFGPAEEIGLRAYMNTYPATESKIDGNVASGTYNLETFGNKDAQGFPAIDYLINSRSVVATVDLFYGNALSPQYKAYLKAVVDKMIEKTTAVKTAWGSYRNTFIEATGTDAAGSLSKMTNAVVLYYERFLRSGKIGYPVGAMTGTALPGHVEAVYTPELSKTLAAKGMESFIAFYEGKTYGAQNTTNGMKDYLANIGTKDNGVLMSDIISQSLGEALTALNGLGGTLKDDVSNNRVAVLGVYDKLQGVVALLKVDMVSAFGISITYVDNDGD